MTKRRAIFLDRDGTLVHPYHYPSRPEHLRLYAGIGPALRRMQDMDFALVLITNQAGIARGYFTVADLDVMHTYLKEQLAEAAVTLDGIYYCPHHVDGVIPELSIRCQCRKPRPGMLLQAAQELAIDLSSSWFVGDILDDIEAGNQAGCHTILVDVGTEHASSAAIRTPKYIARDTIHALTIIKAVTLLESDVSLTYRPPQWSQPASSEEVVCNS
ncbi:D-glycero-alpha-D-manno-heptose-1,7-bisphosphate 7-phosphatase [Dictyobacter arantiisoli]|nr:HAD family hydrolase [Dictyobacter arantiisoli]